MRRLVGYVTICGLPHEVALADDAGEPTVADLWGVYIPTEQRIVLHVNATESLRRLYLTHEMLHAIWEHAGIDALLAGRGDREERVVSVLAAHIRAAEASADLLDLRS